MSVATGRLRRFGFGRGRVTERAREERRLGWMLCAPAVIAMLLVTAYPIGYAIVLSVQDLDLRFPEEGGFVGLDNYASVLTSSLWWTDVFNTLFITVIAVAVELVLGMAIALVMYRAIFGRGAIRTAVLRFFRITLPLMRPAILVALLFRTLDAFRVFDTIFIMTRGAQDTESVSILGYNQLISRLNLGLGSAVSVLIFIFVLVIAFVFVRLFGVRMGEG